jgi:hypothetical protein
MYRLFKPKSLIFVGSVIFYFTLHEVVYGLLYYQFFLDNAIVNIFLTTCMFGVLALLQVPMRVYLEQKAEWSESPLRRLSLQSFLFAVVSSGMIVFFRLLFAYVQIKVSANVFVSLQSVLIDFVLLVIVIELSVLLEFGQY